MYKYAVLMAIPDPRRGERVNIGIVAFRSDRVDVRIPEAGKIACLLPGAWDAYVANVRDRLTSNFLPSEDPNSFASRFALIEPVVRLSDLGWFIADSEDQYELQVTDILAELVSRPRLERFDDADPTARKSKINAEIATVFKNINILAGRNETIDDHKVKRDYYVSGAEGLRADFAVKNGVYHITSTLDLRRESVHIKEAAWKTIILVEAQRNLGSDTQCFGVYAAADASQFLRHIELLRAHANGGIYNWLNPGEHWAYRQAMVAAVQRKGPKNGPLL